MPFIYFAEGVDKPVTLDDARALGLGHAFEETPQSSPLYGRTPAEGRPGMLIWSQARMGQRSGAYQPELQATWRKLPRVEGRDDVWISFYRDAPPTPEQLRKRVGMTGQVVTLGDGREWVAPQLAVHEGPLGFVPCYTLVADVDDEGNWISGGVAADSAHLKELFDELLAAMIDPAGMTAMQGLDYACRLLAINYAVSRVECAMLKILKTDGSLAELLRIALDWETAMAWAQKKTAETSPPDSVG